MGKIIHYSAEYHYRLKEYYFKTWPERSEAYFNYRMVDIPECEEDLKEILIVLDDDDRVVGCNFFFPTRALMQGVDTKVFWSHDTMVDEKYRGDLGIELLLLNQGKDKFGAGLSEINYKIKKKTKAPFLGIEHNYFSLNVLSPISLVNSLFKRFKGFKEFKGFKSINAMGYEFRLVTDVKEMTIPNGGYWFNTESDVEFVRDAHFIDKRFLHNFNKYYLYAHDGADGKTDMYFVVRLVWKQGMYVLTIVDFRYDMGNKEALKAIMKAASTLARKNWIPLTQLCTTMELDKSLYTFKRKDIYWAVVIGPRKMKYKDMSSIVFTSADSDADFLTI